MPQFLFVVEIPPTPEGCVGCKEAPAWSKFSDAANTKTKIARSAKKLQSNAWLLPAENNLPLLMELAALAAKGASSYSAVLIPDGEVTLTLEVKPK
jgi:hypothetical protein